MISYLYTPITSTLGDRMSSIGVCSFLAFFLRESASALQVYTVSNASNTQFGLTYDHPHRPHADAGIFSSFDGRYRRLWSKTFPAQGSGWEAGNVSGICPLSDVYWIELFSRLFAHTFVPLVFSFFY